MEWPLQLKQPHLNNIKDNCLLISQNVLILCFVLIFTKANKVRPHNVVFNVDNIRPAAKRKTSFMKKDHIFYKN